MMRYIIILCAPLLFSLFSFSHERKAVIEEGTSYEIEKVIYPEIVKLHPPAVHFAIALPLFALLSEGFYTLKRKSPDDLEFFTLLVASGAVITTSVTGYIAHKSMESLPIKKEALEALHIHETIGLTLAGLFAFMFLIRAVYVIKSDYQLPFPNAESLLQAGKRVANYIITQLKSSTLTQHNSLKLFVGHGAAFRHAAYHLGLLQREQIKQLSMFHASPIYFELMSDGSWQHNAGNWKQRQTTDKLD